MATGGTRRRTPASGNHHNEVVARRYVREVVRDGNLAVVKKMRDGVVVLDDEDRIVHVNPAAVELFVRVTLPASTPGERDRSDPAPVSGD